MKGHLFLVGAGLKGDHITMRGLNVLKSADVVLYDRLIDKKILSEVRGTLIDVGKLPYKHGMKQSGINELLKKYLLENKTVVRLKGGDTAIFARAIEEVDVAMAVGAEVEIVPGVTAASVAVSKILCSLTDRQTSSGAIFITGHKCIGELDELYDWQALVRLNMTIVIYMGAKNMAFIMNKLLENGLKSEVPVLIAEKLDCSDEMIVLTKASDARNALEKVENPVITIIGDVLHSSHIKMNDE